MRATHSTQKLRDVMSQNVQVIPPQASIMEAARRMRDGDFGMMPVADNDRMIGAISDRDIAVHGVAEGKDPRTPVREVMSEQIYWAYDDDTVDKAVQIMCDHQVRRLPIMDRDKRLVGIVSLGDLAVESGEEDAAAEALSEISKPLQAH